MNAARIPAPTPDTSVSSIAGRMGIVPGSNHKAEEAAPRMKAHATNAIRIGKS